MGCAHTCIQVRSTCLSGFALTGLAFCIADHLPALAFLVAEHLKYNDAYAVAKNFRPHIVTQGELVEMLAPIPPSDLKQPVSAVTSLLRNTLPDWERASRTKTSTLIKRGLEDLFFHDHPLQPVSIDFCICICCMAITMSPRLDTRFEYSTLGTGCRWVLWRQVCKFSCWILTVQRQVSELAEGLFTLLEMD